MRWTELFADLEGRAAALAAAERAGEVGELTRIEVGAIGSADRLLPALGRALRIRTRGDVVVSGALRRCGSDWLLVDSSHGTETLVALPAVLTVAGLGRWSAVPGQRDAIATRLGIRHVLRAMASDRSSVLVHLVDGSAVSGTVDRVGLDFVELAAHATGEARRRTDVRDILLVKLNAMAAVRRDG
jgi:hypothetical protein